VWISAVEYGMAKLISFNKRWRSIRNNVFKGQNENVLFIQGRESLIGTRIMTDSPNSKDHEKSPRGSISLKANGNHQKSMIKGNSYKPVQEKNVTRIRILNSYCLTSVGNSPIKIRNITLKMKYIDQTTCP
jgi:hypothetical protein